MSFWRDLLGVAGAGLAARKGRAVLVMVGPLLGVAAIVGALGVSQSAKGRLQASLRSLGTDLVVVEANADLASSGPPRLPAEAAARARGVPQVRAVAAVTVLEDVDVAASRAGEDAVEARTVQVRAVDETMAGVVDARLARGRFLNGFDRSTGAPAVVVGAAAARALGVLGHDVGTILVGDQPFGVVGVLAPVPLVPAFDTSVFVTYTTAVSEFDDPGVPSQLLVRTEQGAARAAARLLPLAITYGGPGAPTVRVPTDLLEASAEVDRTFQVVVLAMGALAMLIGGLGIANVMTISVLQRSTEIGVRRALGATRAVVGLQFLCEATMIGLVGGLVGVAAGSGFVAAVAASREWVLVLEPAVALGAGLLAVAVAVAAGAYPAARAASLEPLQTLRLG